MAEALAVAALHAGRAWRAARAGLLAAAVFAAAVPANAIAITTATAGGGSAGDRAAPAAAVPPTRIVSLNLCADQLLVDLVPRQRIRALSHLATDGAVSPVTVQAAGIPSTRGEAEVVVGLDPDLVLAGEWSTPATVSLLERIGRRVVKVPLAEDLSAVRRTIRLVAAAVGEPASGERLVGDLDRRLAAASVAAAAAPVTSARHAALVYQVNGLASGPGSLVDALMRSAGLDNHAPRLGLGPGGTVPLEAIVADPPDLVVLTGPVDEYRTAVADNLRHPAFLAVRRARASVVVPWRYWLCGTHHAATAVELLAAARAALPPPAGREPSAR